MKWFLISFLASVLFYLTWNFLFGGPLSSPPEKTLPTGGEDSLSTSSPGAGASGVSLPRPPKPLAGAPSGGDTKTGTAGKKGGNPGGAVPAGRASDPVLEAALGQVLKEGLSLEERARLWDDLARRGLLEEVVRALEEKAGERPDDLKILLLLGEGARRMAALAAGGPEREDWIEMADQAYERALGRNPDNWEARFGRAALLASTPAGPGRRVDGENRLKELIRWQEEKTSKQVFSKTYLLLGDLYAREGNREEARKIWERGLARFPENEELRKRLER
ncbi:MAG TPA: tetratricopeptide repeat protein [Planctomycetes bacterium]|nr:tetratricopeptide repeat protein [Planctomycetota bacterium]